MGFIVCVLLIFLYYGSAFGALCMIGAHKQLIKLSLADWAKVLGISFGGIIFIALAAKTQHAIYTFDSLQVWEPAIHCRDLIFSGVDIFDIADELYTSINYNDKNNFLPMLMAIPLGITGVEFPSFVVCGWIMFAVPSSFALALGIDWYLNKNNDEKNSLPFLMLFIAVIPAFSLAMLWGFMNIAIMLTGTAMFFLCLSMKLDRLDYPKLAMLSLLSVLAVIETRTAAYMVIGCFVGQTFLTIYRAIIGRKFLPYMWILIRGFVIIAVSSLLVLFVAFNGFFMHSIFYDIKTAYSAYNIGATLDTKLLSVAEQFGLIVVLLLLASIIFGLTTKKLRGGVIFAVMWSLTSVLLLCRIQMMFAQHLYIVLVPLAVILLAAVCIMCDSEKLAQKISGAVMCVLLAINFAQCHFEFLPIDFPLFPGHKLIATLPKMNRYDINEISQATSALRKISDNGTAKVYILASGVDVNPDTFNKVDFPRYTNALNLALVHHVDLRDGFPLEFLTTDIIAVVDPIQTHLLPDDQSVIKILAEEMLGDSPISKHFRLEGEYKLHHDRIYANNENDNGHEMTVKIYRKTSPFSANDIDYLNELFNQRYATYPRLFQDRLKQFKKDNFGQKGTNE